LRRDEIISKFSLEPLANFDTGSHAGNSSLNIRCERLLAKEDEDEVLLKGIGKKVTILTSYYKGC